MSNIFYTATGIPVYQTRATSSQLNGEFIAIQGGFDLVAPLANPVFTGTPAAPTAAAGTSTTQLATTAFCAALAFSSTLPGQSSNGGKYIKTDGATATWQFLTMSRSARTTNTILAAADTNTWINATTSFSQTLTSPVTLGAGWYCFYTNSSATDMTFTPAAGNIDGAATGKLKAGTSIIIFSDGANFLCERVGARVRENLTSGTSYTTGLGIRVMETTLAGGGGSGGCSASASVNGGGASSGSAAKKLFTVSPNTAYAYTIGAGGASVNGNNINGNVGTSTTMTVGGTTVTANGGSAGQGGTAYVVVKVAAVSTNGDINVAGGYGMLIYDAGNHNSIGGSTPFGLGIGGTRDDSATAVVATGYGAGGYGTVVNTASGAGMPGIIILEY